MSLESEIRARSRSAAAGTPRDSSAQLGAPAAPPEAGTLESWLARAGLPPHDVHRLLGRRPVVENECLYALTGRARKGALVSAPYLPTCIFSEGATADIVVLAGSTGVALHRRTATGVAASVRLPRKSRVEQESARSEH